jgi:hypothetical protein
VTRHKTLKTETLALLLLGDDGLRAAREHNGTPVPFPTDQLEPDMEKAQLGCALCGRTNTLYENVMVPGWIAVNGHRFEDDGETVRPTIRRRDYEVEIDDAEHENYACNECCRDGTYLERLALVVPPKRAGTAGS